MKCNIKAQCPDKVHPNIEVSTETKETYLRIIQENALTRAKKRPGLGYVLLL